MDRFGVKRLNRDELRRRIAKERQARASSALETSEKIVANLVSWLGRGNRQWDGKIIATYRVMPDRLEGEVDLATLPAHAELLHTHFAYPRIVDRFVKKMDFAIPVHESDWAPGVYGIPEPRLDLLTVRPKDIEMILIPGVVFGERGERLGRGAGFYDRFLSDIPGTLRVGVAFDFQVISDEIPQEPWDARMDLIVTESRILEISEKT